MIVPIDTARRNTDYANGLAIPFLLPQLVDVLLKKYIDLWWECESILPDFGLTYKPDVQHENEVLANRFIDILIAELKNSPTNAVQRQAANGRLEPAARELAVTALGFSSEQLDAMPSGPYLNEMIEFAQEAHHFDPTLPFPSIFQASRNVWTAIFLQMLLGMQQQLTPAIFGYSLIYPYSDNYIDDPTIPEADKFAFSERFKRYLTGESLVVDNPIEQKIFDLVDIIESQHKRADNPQVFASLAAIHQAQCRSIDLLGTLKEPGASQVLETVFEKGGTSVMADGYLLTGDLTASQQMATFSFGVLTQLVDDLEDVTQDLRDGLMTVFSQTALNTPLDAATNRTLQFAGRVLSGLTGQDIGTLGYTPSKADKTALNGLLQRGVQLLILNSIARARRFYTPTYLRTIEPYLPFSFRYLDELQKKLNHRRVSLVNLVEHYILGNG
jgi:hypothetical protein